MKTETQTMGLFFLHSSFWCYNLEDAIIASNANIGGTTAAAGMVISQGWTALVDPVMLIDTMGYVVCNYLGTADFIGIFTKYENVYK